MKLAVLDDYQGTAKDLGDWSSLPPGTTVQFFQDHIADEDKLVERLKGFDMVMGMRERTPFTRTILSRLPKLRLLITTGLKMAHAILHLRTGLKLMSALQLILVVLLLLKELVMISPLLVAMLPPIARPLEELSQELVMPMSSISFVAPRHSSLPLLLPLPSLPPSEPEMRMTLLLPSKPDGWCIKPLQSQL